MMINSVEKFSQNLGWKVLFFLNPSHKQSKENFGFKSTKLPPPIPQLKDFEKDLIDLMKNIEFLNQRNDFQDKLKTEEEAIKNEDKLLVAADKTTNFYKVDPEKYQELLEKEVNNDYKKENIQHIQKINKAHKQVVRDLDIADRVFKTVDREAFVTLKDHKENFDNNPKCRLLNPTKGGIGKISKQILSKIVLKIRSQSGLKQWKNSFSVVDWFKQLKNKKGFVFIIFDIVNYYPNITVELLTKALKWAELFVDISEQEKNIILQSRKNFLFKNGEYWVKRKDSEFDVTQGGFDAAEVADIVGLFMLSELEKLKLKATWTSYKDDGLGVSDATPRQVENMKKKVRQVFNKTV